jgi:hypothetical protein
METPFDEDDEYTYNDDADYSEPFGNEEWVLDCGYQGCCMPGYHFRSECHNADDIEQYEAELTAEKNREPL